MKSQAHTGKANRKISDTPAHDSSAGENAIALAPPAYGIKFVDLGPESGAPLAIQRKLTISTPEDYFEREADRAADEVMRMPEPPLSRIGADSRDYFDCRSRHATRPRNPFEQKADLVAERVMDDPGSLALEKQSATSLLSRQEAHGLAEEQENIALRPSEGAKALSQGEKWIGTPYKYGGDSKGGIDCSHFIHRAYSEAGLDYDYLSTSSFSQSPNFSKIAAPLVGDVILFKGHMGIYNPSPPQNGRTLLSAANSGVSYGEPDWFGSVNGYYRYERREELHGKLQKKSMDEHASSAGSVPLIVEEVLRSPGEPLDPTTRAFTEPRFGHNFGDVRVHTDAEAAKSAAAVNARAFTVNRDIAFAAGEYAPHSESGRRLLYHELAHTIQQSGRVTRASLQRTACIDERGAGPFAVSVIGAPGPGEIRVAHPYQFVNAARYQGVNRNTVWIVEQTGYVAGGIDTAQIESDVAIGCLIWLTPHSPLSSIIRNEFPDSSIASMTVYSHGLPGLATLRYGWESRGLPNYGLSLDQVRSLSAEKFSPDATIEFNSCNTGTTTDEGNLAQEAAYYTGRKVRAWTGRTSYAEVNDGDADKDAAVHGSETARNNRVDWVEVGSRLSGRTPRLTTFSPPGHRTTEGFTSNFEIVTRLPKTRHFNVPEGGLVVVTCENGTYLRPDRPPNASDRIGVHLIKSEDWAIDSRFGHESLRADRRDIAVFRNLRLGKYYLEIIAESAPVSDYETLTSDIAVDVYEA